MASSRAVINITLENRKYLSSWWQSLSPSWKQAFSETVLRHVNEPTPEELAQIYSTTVFRFAGPKAPYPNMSVELEDLSGMEGLPQVEILVVTHHRVKSMAALHSLVNLKSLFLNNNCINGLEGIEGLQGLRQLFVQYNCITSIKPLQALLNLQECYIHDNLLESLEGLTEEHAETMRQFFCKPNPGLKQKEIMRVERELGIRCQGFQ